MGGPEVGKMRDMIDVYIKQNMKNWVTRLQPSDSGRARLLLLASARDRINDIEDIDHELPERNKRSKYIIPFTSTRPPVEQAFEPISQTRLWLFQISPMLLRNVT
jgi:hypothetical protein